MTTTLATLEQRLSELIGDWIECLVTTAINADNLVVSTNLNEYDGGINDYFNGWYCYITDKANAGVERQISDYATATGTITVRGAVLADDAANLATIRVYRHSRTNKVKAINRAIEELYPSLHKRRDDLTLVTGNNLPNGHFEDWASSSYPDLYAVTNATAAETNTAGLFRGATASSKVSATAADGYMYITSNTFPRLLDLMGHTVSFYAWAYPEVADDAFLTIYTLQADGTAQTLNSVTTCPAGAWTRLLLGQQTLNDELVKVEFRFRVHTNAKYAYFDDAIVIGHWIYEYLLPADFQIGNIDQVYIQTSGTANHEA